MNRAHPTPEERAQLGAMLERCGPHEILTIVALWVRQNVPDFATADEIASAITKAARPLGTP